MEYISKCFDFEKLRKMCLENMQGYSSNESLEESFCEKMNNKVGNKKYIDCPKCKNRGYICVFDKKTDMVSFRPCKCMGIRDQYERIEASGLSEVIKTKTFETFETVNAWQKQYLCVAKKFSTQSIGWFYIGGQVGSGKTHLCTAICKSLLDNGRAVKYMRWKDEATKIKALITDESKYSRLITCLKTAEVLYIDDLFKTERATAPKPADINLAFEILNYRYSENLKTILSSEYYIDELIEIDEAVGSRIFEKSKGYCIGVSRSKEKNYRLKNG